MQRSYPTLFLLAIACGGPEMQMPDAAVAVDASLDARTLVDGGGTQDSAAADVGADAAVPPLDAAVGRDAGPIDVGPPRPDAADYYVSMEGDDESDGSADAPLRTIPEALLRAGAGETIWVRGGTYDGGVEIRSGGAPERWLTLAGYPGELPIIDGGGGRALSVELGAEYVLIENFEFRNMGNKGVGMHSNWTVLRDSIVHDAGEEAISMKGREGDAIRHHNMVEGCTIYDVNFAIFPDTQMHSVIRNNVFFDARTVAIDPGGFRFGLIENNYFRHNQAVENGTRGPFKIRFGDRSGECGNACAHDDGTIIRRNVIVGGSKYALLIEDAGGVAVYHNTFVNHGVWRDRGLLYMASPGEGEGNPDNIVINNVFSQTNMRVIDFNGSMESHALNQHFDFNLYFKSAGDDYISVPNIGAIMGAGDIGEGRAWTRATGYDAHSLAGQNPLFVASAPNAEPAGYALVTESPGLDAAGPLTTTTGEGMTTEVPVRDVRVFSDGHGLISGDVVAIGGAHARVIGVDREGSRILLSTPVRFRDGDAVHGAFRGAAPDMGAFELGLEQEVGAARGRERAF